MPSEIRYNLEPLAQRAEVALTAVDLQIELKSIAGFTEGDTTETRIRRASHRVGISYATARALWYGAVKDPRGSIIEKIHQAKSEATRHADNLERAAIALEAINPDFHRAEIDRLRDVARQLRSGNAASQRQQRALR